MHWDPELYDTYKELRSKPFFDLTNLIKFEHVKNVIDLGCGTGQQISILAQQYEQIRFLGIDSSEEMLAKSKSFLRENLVFRLCPIERMLDDQEKWDVIVSNAALQWLENHDQLFPRLLNLLSENGQIAVQMPVQQENILNQILANLADEAPYCFQLRHMQQRSPVLSMDDYAKILFHHGMQNIHLSIKVYPMIANKTEDLFQFIAGTALRPYLNKLREEDRPNFIKAYKLKINKHFGCYPAIYAFKRMLLYGCKTKPDVH